MKKRFDPFTNLQLDPYEQEINDAIEQGKVKEEKVTDEEKKRLAGIARYTLDHMKKDKRVNIRIKANDLNAIRGKAEENGLPYQTLMSTILHHFATGKIKIQL